MVRDVVLRILEVEHINYSTPSRFNPETDLTVDENGIQVLVDHEANRIAEEKEVAEEVAAAAASWKFKPDLSASEYSRLVLLNKLLSQQLRGKTVSIGNLKSALTAEEYAEYESSLAEPISSSEILYADGVPKELKRYNLMLRDADFQYYKYEKMNGLKSSRKANYKTETLSKEYYKSEHLYERALEYLEEQMGYSEREGEGDRLRRWLDRDVVFGPNGNTGIQADGVPRVKGSRSHEALDAALPKMSVRLKRQQRVLENLLRSAVACAYVAEIEKPQQEIPRLKPLNIANLFSERD